MSSTGRHSVGPQLRNLATAISRESFDDAIRVVGACLPSSGDAQGLLREVAREAQAAVDGGSATPDLLWCQAAAASYALRQCTDLASAADLVDTAAAAVYLPLLRLSAAQPSVLAVQRHLAGLLCACSHWAAACAVIRAATSDAGLAQGQGSGQAQPAAAALSSGSTSAAAPSWQPALLQLPAHLRIQLAASVVEVALDSCDQAVESSGSSSTAPAAVQSGAAGEQPSVQHALALVCGSAFSPVLCMLGRADLALTTQRALARHLLPAALRAAERMGRLHECLSGLLATCRELIVEAGEHRRAGLALLVQFTPQLLLPLPGQAPLLGDPAEWLDDGAGELTSPMPMWQLLRECLVDADPLNRKRAAHVLKAALLNSTTRGGDRPGAAQADRLPAPWDTYFKLSDTVEEFSLHLVEAAWPDIDKLHPAGAPVQAGSQGAAAKSTGHSSSKGGAKRRGKTEGSASPSAGQQGGSSSPAVPFAWMRMLWLRGLTNRNNQVQRLVAASLLGREWGSASGDAAAEAYLLSVPAAFLGQELLQALGQPHMHKPAGGTAQAPAAAPPAGSSASGLSPVAAQAVQLTRQYCAAAARARQLGQACELLLCMLRQLAEREPQRALMQTAVAMLRVAAEELAAAGAGADADAQRQQQGQGAAGGLGGGWAGEVLGLLGAACKKSTRSFGTCNFAMESSQGLVRVAADVLSISTAEELELLGQWVADFQLALIQPGAPLHAALAELLALCTGGGLSGLLALLVDALLSGNSLTSGRSSYGAAASSSCCSSSSTSAPVSPAELADLQAQAGCIARLVLLATSLQQGSCGQRPTEAASAAAGGGGRAADLAALGTQLDAILGQLAPTLEQLYRRPYLKRGTAESSLALLHALLEVCTPVDAAAASCLPPSQLLLWLARTLAACSEELCSYAGMKVQALWTAPGQHSTQSDSGQQAATIGLARLSVNCVASALPLLQVVSKAQRSEQLPVGSDLSKELSAAAHRICAVLGQYIQEFAAQQLQMGSLGGEEQPHAAQLECLAASLQALLAIQQQELCWPGNQQGPPVVACGMLLQKLLPLHMVEGRGPAAADTQRWWWRAVNGLLELHQCRAAAAAAQTRGGIGSAAAGSSGTEGLSEEAAGQLLHVAVCSLGTAHRTSIVGVLRCLRALLPRAVLEPGVLQHTMPAGAEPASLAGLLSWLYSKAWAACSDGIKRRTGLTAAFVATCLHPVLFDVQQADDSRLALHQEGGPIKELVGKLMAAGQRSPRIMAMAALQLCGAWGPRPLVAMRYCAELRAMCLYGVVEDWAGSEGEVLTDAESVAELAAVISPTDPQLAAAYQATPIAPRVAALCLLHQWATAGATAQQVAAQEMWGQLLEAATQDPELASNKYIMMSAMHRRKVRLWQALCVLSPAVTAQQARAALDAIIAALGATNAATVKQYQEAVAVQLIRREPSLLKSRVMPALHDYTDKSDAPVSLVLVAAQVLLYSGTGSSGQASSAAAQQALAGEEAVAEYCRAVVGWTLSHVHALRTFSQLILWRMLELYPSLPASDPSLAAMLAFLSTNADIRRLRAGLGAGIDLVQPDVSTSPRGVLCQGRWPVGQGSDPRGGLVEGAPKPLLDRVGEFLMEARAQLRQQMAAEQAEFAEAELSRDASIQPPPTVPTEQQQQQQQRVAGQQAEAHEAPQQQAQQGQFWQRKVTPLERSLMLQDPWAAALGISVLSSGGADGFEEVVAGAAAEVARQAGAPRQELILVASLVDKVPNLAGLARTCEVFGAGCLVLSDASVCKDPGFASISVTAEQWVPIKEVPESALLPWLRRQAGRGYTLVGLEQTAESTRLQDFCFPQKTVLVLGREKEGVPADVLAVLHHTVEIPQLGLIRSLNVHVSGAIALYEYTRQGLERQGADGGSA